MHYLAKDLLAVAANVTGSLATYAVLRSMTYTRHQAIIDYLVLLIGCTAHLWYATEISWTRRITIAVASAILISYGMFTFATAVLRDAT
jgi:hypothetical protein